MEENYFEMQFQHNYFKEINRYLSPNFEFDKKGDIAKLNMPLQISADEKNIFLTYLWKIEVNRSFILRYYADMERKIQDLTKRIEKEIK